MEKEFLVKIEEGKRELEDFKAVARETEKDQSLEIKNVKEEKAKSIAEKDLEIEQAQTELTEVR